eukprot:UN12024
MFVNLLIRTTPIVLTTIYNLTPIYELNKLSVRQNIGSNSFVPYFTLFFNTILWAVYGVLSLDYTQLCSNIPALLSCCIYVFWWYRIAYKNQLKNKHEIHKSENLAFIIMTILLCFFYFLITFCTSTQEAIDHT